MVSRISTPEAVTNAEPGRNSSGRSEEIHDVFQQRAGRDPQVAQLARPG